MQMLKSRSLVVGGLLLAMYVGTYYGLSRRGYSESDRYAMKGFYYLAPADTDGWQFAHRFCTCFFHPLNLVDRWLGFGRRLASEPMWGISAYFLAGDCT